MSRVEVPAFDVNLDELGNGVSSRTHAKRGPGIGTPKKATDFDAKRGHPQWVPAFFGSFRGHFWPFVPGPRSYEVYEPVFAASCGLCCEIDES